MGGEIAVIQFEPSIPCNCGSAHQDAVEVCWRSRAPAEKGTRIWESLLGIRR